MVCVQTITLFGSVHKCGSPFSSSCPSSSCSSVSPARASNSMPSSRYTTRSAAPALSMRLSRKASSPAPLAKIISASAILATSCGVGSKLCGSAPTGSKTATWICSPPTWDTTSPMMVVVATTVRASAPDADSASGAGEAQLASRITVNNASQNFIRKSLLIENDFHLQG